jgi:hypothetical protein
VTKQQLFFYISLLVASMHALKCTSQNTQNTIPLAQIIDVFSKRYNVRFSYANNTVKNIKIKTPKETLTLDEALLFLEQESKLVFTLINNRFISISKPKTPKKAIVREQLEEITITNYLTTGITKLNDGSLTITPEKFGILPGLIEPDVLQTIQALPGIFSAEELVSNINVRGGTHDQNLILWDGIKMYQSGHFFGLISAFNPYTVDKINISKNGSRAKFGDGISSVIDIQLHNTIDGKFEAGLGFNLINAHAHAKIPLSQRLELQISSRRSVTDLIATPTYNQYFNRVFQDSDLSNTLGSNASISQNEAFQFHDIAAKLLYNLSKKDQLRFHFLNVSNTLNYEESATLNNRDEALNSNLSQQNLAYSITHTRDWHKRLQTKAQIYITNYDLAATNFDIINNQRLKQRNEVVDGTAKLDVNYKLNANSTLNGGYQFSEVGISNLQDVNNPLFRSFTREVVRTHAVYAESAFLSKSAKTRLNIGTRITIFNKFNTVLIEPRLNFSQRFLNVLRLEILGELKHQTTSQTIDFQSDFLGIERRRWVLSNSNTETVTVDGKSIFPVPILRSNQISAGLHYNKNKLLISAEGFIKKVDGITTRSQGFQNQFEFVNASGSYTINGIDVLVNKQFQTAFSAALGYSYSTNTYEFDSLQPEPFPNNVDVRHALTLSSAYTTKHLKLALGFNWYTGRPTTLPNSVQDPDATEISYQSPNLANLEDYMRADFSTTYAFNMSQTTKAFIGASIWNVFNTRNVLNSYFTLDEDSNITKIDIESLGITPNVSFRVLF